MVTDIRTASAESILKLREEYGSALIDVLRAIGGSQIKLSACACSRYNCSRIPLAIPDPPDFREHILPASGWKVQHLPVVAHPTRSVSRLQLLIETTP